MKLMKAFKRGEKGFTLVELLIVVAILGILAAVVIPNVLGLLGRGGKQAFETDSKNILTATATFYSDGHRGFDATNLEWCDSTQTIARNVYPTVLGLQASHVLTVSDTEFDANNNPRVVVFDPVTKTVTGNASQTDIINHAIWMGLLINNDGDYTGAAIGNGTDDATLALRGKAAPLGNDSSLYIDKMPKTASLYNGRVDNPGTYTWIVGYRGVVYGVYDGDLAGSNDWYAGFKP